MSQATAALMMHDSEQKRILIAEDFTETAASMKRLLEYEGYKVYIAVDGQMAVEKALPIRPDLIILDAIMPVMNGLEACRIIKENTATRNIPVIFISADDRQETRDTALSLGALRYFIKPIDTEEVFEFIAQTLGTVRSTVLIEEETRPEVTDIALSKKNKAKDPFRLCGMVLDSKYELIEFAGAGGMGAVYRAVNRTNGETVAVKILQPHIVARSPEYAELFEREAKHAQGLDHEHIVKIYDSGKDDDLSYMVMEWVEGRSLEDVLTQGQIPLDRLTCIFEQICGAVAFAHERNVIHLDLKPGNILLVDGPDAENFVKVIDFGLSRVISQESGTTVTKFRGTHQFCAPEQFGGKVSYRSDIYSLGATLYYLLTGVIPFGGSYINAKIHPNLELPEIPSITRQRSVPTGIDSVIKKALNKKPNLRQQSVMELYEEFRAALELHTQDSENKLPSTASSERKPRGMANEGKGRYVRRDEQGRFYESDDIGRSLRIDSERRKKEENLSSEGSNQSRNTSKHDWNNPQVACSLLSHIKGFQTGTYKSTGIEGDYFCCSPYKDVTDESTLANHIAYYVEGDAEKVHRLKLVLNVNVSEKAEESRGLFMAYCDELALKALGEGLSPEMKGAIIEGQPVAYTVRGLFVELKREAWPTGRGYEMKFMITKPVGEPIEFENSLDRLTIDVLPTATDRGQEPKILVRITDPEGDYRTRWSVTLRSPSGVTQTRDATWPGSGQVFRARFPTSKPRVGRWSGVAVKNGTEEHEFSATLPSPDVI